MAKPMVVIVGRPNVGKSTLFNRIVRARVAIVEDSPGVTRDLHYHEANYEDRSFVVVDTGGFFPRHDDNIFTQIKEQALFAITEADVIIHLLDASDGVNPFDADLAETLRASGKKILWVVNKIDSEKREDRLLEFYSLGIDEPIPVSAHTGYNYFELMDQLIALFPESTEEEEAEYPRVAIVGRPNVGKSTMVNSLLGKKRMIVSDIPGTTRDAVDTMATYYKRKYLLIDTAGIRHKDRHGYSIEHFAMLRAMRSIERSDVVVVMIDATEGIVAEDQRIAGMAHENGKSVVFLFNKWDLIEDHDKVMKKLTRTIERKLWFYREAPILTTSGIEKQRITKLFPIIDELMEERNKRVQTSKLNKFVETLNLPTLKGKRVKVYYMTQYRTSPPGFALFTNLPDGIKDNHLRNIETTLRELFGFRGTPIWIKIRQRG